jgi:predicted DNA-binding transcriptional regulator AlpA
MSEGTLAVDVLDDGFLSTEQLAELIGVDASTLRRWRTAEPPEGPPFVPISERVTKYCRSDVRQWIAQRRISPARGR